MIFMCLNVLSINVGLLEFYLRSLLEIPYYLNNKFLLLEPSPTCGLDLRSADPAKKVQTAQKRDAHIKRRFQLRQNI